MTSYLELNVGTKTVTQNASDTKAQNILGDVVLLFNLDPNGTNTQLESLQAVLDLLVATIQGWSAQYRAPDAEQAARDTVVADTDYKFIV